MGRIIITLIGLAPPHFCVCPKQGAGFPTSYVSSLFLFSDLRREVIVRCVDSVGIIDNHCSIFRFKMNHHCNM